jgi:NAD(P)-dependent dehydrogenase (short-subunit alcohol dehydrogenase family)
MVHDGKGATVKRLEGRVALVTGGASGIGKATAHRLAQEGAALVITDIQDEAGELVAKGIRELGGQATYLHHGGGLGCRRGSGAP